jgi:hypothetical protein
MEKVNLFGVARHSVMWKHEVERHTHTDTHTHTQANTHTYLFEVVKGREDDIMAPSHETHGCQQLQHEGLGSVRQNKTVTHANSHTHTHTHAHVACTPAPHRRTWDYCC